ncbi:hypothetical protein V8C86DRAFT_3029895 [Haematococcus lacustris]
MATLRASQAISAKPVISGISRRGVVVRAHAKQSRPVMEAAKAVSLATLSGAVLSPQAAQAATEVAQLAAGDNRPLILGTLLLPVLGWVAFNIGGPLFAQLDKMGERADETTPDKRSLRLKRAVIGPMAGLGLLAATQSAEAATEIAQLAAGDNRPIILLTLLLPVLGWVAFNIGGPLFAQLDKMGERADETTPDKRSLRISTKRS